jgi:hypothetical protein
MGCTVWYTLYGSTLWNEVKRNGSVGDILCPAAKRKKDTK